MDIDPDVTLRLAREYMLEAIEYAAANDGQMDTESVASALDAYRDLDKWISDGGFLPEAWKED